MVDGKGDSLASTQSYTLADVPDSVNGIAKDKYYIDNAGDSLIETGRNFDNDYNSVCFTLANHLEGLPLKANSGANDATIYDFVSGTDTLRCVCRAWPYRSFRHWPA